MKTPFKTQIAFALALAISLSAFAKNAHKSHSRDIPEFRADLLVPGKTEESQLESLVGNPLRSLHDRGRVLYFYDVGLNGASMTATVSARRGVVESITYFCDEKLADVTKKYGESQESRVAVSGVEKRSLRGGMKQITFEGSGRAFLFTPRSETARVCIKWEPGKKFSEIGG